MQSNFEKFNKLPSELKLEIAQNLSNCDLVSLVQTSKYHLALFQPVIDVRKVRKLLHHVTRGEHDAVKAMLKQDISLIFERGIVTDCSGREFGNISGFEYALWALDKHMWAAMIACISSKEEGRKIFAQLIAQYNKVNSDGVTYKLKGQTITEKHFDFENTIIKALQTHVNSINAPGVKDRKAINKQWREGVGGAQKLQPMHVVYEYCYGVPFYPVPNFTIQPYSCKKKIHNIATGKKEDWFSVDSKLSVDFAIFKEKCGEVCSYRLCPELALRTLPDYDGSHELGAMTALCKVRTDDFINLKSQLEKQAEHQHTSVINRCVLM